MGAIVKKHTIPHRLSKESARFRQPSPDVKVRENNMHTFDHLASNMFKTSEINYKTTQFNQIDKSLTMLPK